MEMRFKRMSDATTRSGRIATVDHHDPAWHIHEVAADFQLIDAWRLPVAGAYEEFGDLTELFVSLDLAQDDGSRLSDFLFAARTKLGEVLGWDEEVLSQPIPGCQEISLRDRLSGELRTSAEAIDDSSSEFSIVYHTETESVLELSNSTVHAAVHFAWVRTDETEAARYVAQMGIYVKTRGTLGRLYMPAIAPFRHYIVYPALMRRLERAWQQRHG